MTRQLSSRQLAVRLTEIAREVARTHGDLTAQTATYGLLVRRWNSSVNVDRLIEPIADASALASIEAALDGLEIDAVRAAYCAEGKDPSIYFYEQFLKAYDAASSRGRGVLYTPPEVVSFMLRAVEAIISHSFDAPMDDALIIDPCCGVGTFLRHIEAHTQHRPRMLGLELMPAACAIAKCLVNTAEIRHADWLTSQLNVNGQLPVIIGNPPYSGHSANVGKVADLMARYRLGLRERNPKWLQDDYVKFIRMAQHTIQQASRGIVAFITNHSFLFNPTFRAMRESLMETFDRVDIVDLGGNVKQLDCDNENVFPIQMGVAIAFMMKNSRQPGCAVRYTEIRGSKQTKLTLLRECELSSLTWSKIHASAPFNVFRPQDANLVDEFYGFPSVVDLFRKSSMGFATSRDSFAIAFTGEELMTRIAALRDGSASEDALRKMGVGDLDILSARRLLQADPDWQSKAIEVLYRPFDRRWAYYSRAIMERPRLPFMEDLMQENVAIAIGRAGQVTGSSEWDVVFCTDRPTDLNLFRRGGAKLFPLYLYTSAQRIPNMQRDDVPIETLFSYIYALLHSRIYRSRYAEMLRLDYPRIPIPHSPQSLRNLADIGRRLMEVHLTAPDRSPQPSCRSDAEPVTATMRIGGYDEPDRFARDRASVAGVEEIEAVRKAIREASVLRKAIDAEIDRRPPWQQPAQ